MAAAESGEAVEGPQATVSSDIIVIGERNEYGVTATSTATRTSTLLRNIPQALTVLSERQIEDQDLRSIADILTFVPGATPGTGEANRDQMTLRGQNSTADFFVDGVRDDVQYFRDLYNVERVEVLRGPNAMIFGRGGGGGVVNRVMKRPTFATSMDVAIAGDSEAGLRGTVDIDRPVGDGVGLRLNMMADRGESFRRHVDLRRYGINPAIAFQAGPDTRIDLSFEHARDRRTTDRGVPSLGGEPIAGFDRTFFGDPEDSYAKSRVDRAVFTIEHGLADGLILRNRTLAVDHDKFYQNIYPGRVDGEEVVLGAYNSRNDRRNLFSQTDLVWEAPLAGIDQTLLFGVELGRQESRNRRQSGSFATGSNRVPLSDPTVDADVIFAPSASDANNRARADIAAVYVQQQLRPSEWIELVAGLRFDRFQLKVDDRRAAVAAEFRRSDNLWSPRLGLILKPLSNLSLYGSYSRSYLPQSGDQFSGLDLTSSALKPERFDNVELGAKWEPVTGLLATAAVYQLDRSNSRAPDPLDPSRVVLTGEQRSRGVELALERSISDRWQVSAGYAWQKAEIVDATASAPAGREVPLVPRRSLSIWTRYDLTPSLGAGIGVVARSKSFASISNDVRLPGYARVDAAIYQSVGRGMEVQVNVENLFGADYFGTAHNDNNIAPGAPRTVRATIRHRM